MFKLSLGLALMSGNEGWFHPGMIVNGRIFCKSLIILISSSLLPLLECFEQLFDTPRRLIESLHDVTDASDCLRLQRDCLLGLIRTHRLDELFCTSDANLLGKVIFNIVSSAIFPINKFSPLDLNISVSINVDMHMHRHARGGMWCYRIIIIMLIRLFNFVGAPNIVWLLHKTCNNL